MGLKQIEPRKRIFFLKHFTTELVNNSVKEERIKKRIEIQKLKQKFAGNICHKEKFSKEIFEGPVFQPSRYIIKPNEYLLKIPEPVSSSNEEREPIIYRMKIPKKRATHRLKKLLRFPENKTKSIGPQIVIHPRIQALTSIRPQAQPIPEGFSLGKLEPLIRDISIQSIECSGPNKSILVKRYNRFNTTKIILNQEEITDVIDSFSTQAKIPIVGGLLKAVVGDLIISAVISEFVGSRFIINKITPYSMIEES